MKTRSFLMLAAALACAAAAFAALSPEKAAWARGPVQFLMTKEEVTAGNSLQSDAEADAFIATFWARRDPTPGTARNEFRDDFEARVQYADENFAGGGGVRGSLTDMGRILIVFGPPTRRIRSGGQGRSTVALPSARPGSTLPPESPAEAVETQNSEKQLWIYEGETAQKAFGVPRLELLFVDLMNDRDLRLQLPKIDLASAQQRMVNSSITQPTLSKPPAQTVVVPMPETPAPMTTLKTAALESAILDARSGKVPGKGASITFAEFVAPTGEYYVPVGLFVPGSAGLSADAADTFFGVIEDANGKRVEVFEDPAKGMLSRNNLLFDRTVTLPSGKYTATFGLAKAGSPVLIASAPIELNVVSKEATGTSKLILSDIVETMEAAPVRSPFAFGKLKIVPRASFGSKDELGYFVEVHNPGIDSATNLPKLQTRVDLVPPSGPTISAPLSDVPALPLSGAPGPGQYAIISAIPLSELKSLAPGDYALRIKIVDTVSKQSYTVEQKFRIAG